MKTTEKNIIPRNRLVSLDIIRGARSRMFHGLLHGFKGGLAAVGRMVLSNYLMQTVICIFIFYGFGFNLYNELGRASLLFVMVMIWVFQFFFSIIWLRYFHYGPVEWLWRGLTLRKKIPLKIRYQTQN